MICSFVCLSVFCSKIYLVAFVLLCVFSSRPEGVLEKRSINCCSVWAWRKSGIKILVTAGGLLFFIFFQFLQKGVDFRHFFSQNKELGTSGFLGTLSSLFGPQILTFWTPVYKNMTRREKKSDEARKNHPRTQFSRFGVGIWRFRTKKW